jgi:hypothetical protein
MVTPLLLRRLAQKIPLPVAIGIITRKMVMNRIIPAQNFFPLEDDQSYHVFGTVFSSPASPL